MLKRPKNSDDDDDDDADDAPTPAVGLCGTCRCRVPRGALLCGKCATLEVCHLIIRHMLMSFIMLIDVCSSRVNETPHTGDIKC